MLTAEEMKLKRKLSRIKTDEKRLDVIEHKLVKIEKQHAQLHIYLSDLETTTLQSAQDAVEYFIDRKWSKTRIRKALGL